MKKLLLILILIVAVSCTKEGQIQRKSNQHIKINGKEYYFMKVVPADNEEGIWLMLPKDSNVEIPQRISYKYRTSCGKHCHKTHQATCFMIASNTDW